MLKVTQRQIMKVRPNLLPLIKIYFKFVIITWDNINSLHLQKCHKNTFYKDNRLVLLHFFFHKSEIT